jgi:hypothetical protein
MLEPPQKPGAIQDITAGAILPGDPRVMLTSPTPDRYFDASIHVDWTVAILRALRVWMLVRHSRVLAYLSYIERF